MRGRILRLARMTAQLSDAAPPASGRTIHLSAEKGAVEAVTGGPDIIFPPPGGSGTARLTSVLRMMLLARDAGDRLLPVRWL
jgi:hypothetical protein